MAAGGAGPRGARALPRAAQVPDRGHARAATPRPTSAVVRALARRLTQRGVTADSAVVSEWIHNPWLFVVVSQVPAGYA